LKEKVSKRTLNRVGNSCVRTLSLSRHVYCFMLKQQKQNCRSPFGGAAVVLVAISHRPVCFDFHPGSCTHAYFLRPVVLLLPLAPAGAAVASAKQAAIAGVAGTVVAKPTQKQKQAKQRKERIQVAVHVR
jgi:hypothetical protein